MLQRLYDWTMRLAAGKHALLTLCLISFAESSFFPIPPDVLLIPMILAAPHRAWSIAAMCTISSVLGGFLGYGIGYYLFDTVGRPVLDFYHAMDKYDAFKAGFGDWGVWIIIAKGWTPIPYKLITIASGVAQFDLAEFAFASLISRAMRFFLVAALLWRFGEPIRTFIERRLALVTTLFLVGLVGGFVVIRYL